MKRVRQTLLAIIVTLLPALALSAPMGYSINSDSGTEFADSLHRIDLSTGDETMVGKLLSLGELRRDTEGLAMDPDGMLWGIDDDSLTLFPIDAGSGAVFSPMEVSLQGFSAGGGHDFGLSFTCSGDLYATSLKTKTLYRLGLDGSATTIGSEGDLGVKISSIAAYGNPGRLLGLGNGEDSGDGDVRTLYEIDMSTGVASAIGSLSANAGDYTESGLAFDDDGTLWAITDRRVIAQQEVNAPSEILRIDTTSGQAEVIGTTTEIGYESLAIAPPGGCALEQDPDLDEEYHRIPTLSPFGLVIGALLLMLFGFGAMRHRPS